MDSTTERIDIINSFKLIGREKNEKVEMHLQTNYYLFLLSGIAFSITLLIVLSKIMNVFLENETSFNWNRAGLIVIISITSCTAMGRELYKMIILKHLKFLETSTVKVFNEHLNDELISLVSKLNKSIGIVALMSLIFIGILINSFMDYQLTYYNFLIAPTLLFYVLAPLNIWANYKKLKANINQVENNQLSFTAH